MREQGSAVRVKRSVKDIRLCLFCGLAGDQDADGPGRLEIHPLPSLPPSNLSFAIYFNCNVRGL